MQIGQTIWAIDPMKSFFTGNNQFTVGNSYKIEKVEETTFYVQCDTGEFKVILKSWFDEYFSLTPPKEKEGDKAEEIYHRFVQYEWNEVSEGMKKSILNAINEALKINPQS